MAKWQAINYEKSIPDVTSKTFSISCPKGTDIFDKPPSTHRFDAPVIYTTTTVGAFKSAAVTVRGDWTYQYDQGGLCLFIDLNDGTRKWLKTGIEFVDSLPRVSVVTKDRWADWSLTPLLNTESKSARLRIETHDDGSLWVYLVDDAGKKHPVREVTWWGEFDRDTQVNIGPAAAKPSTEGGDLPVTFEDFSLVTS